MTTNMTEQQLAALIANVVGQVLQGQAAMPKAASAKQHFLPKGSHMAPADKAARDAQILAAFTRKGFKNVQLRENVFPFKLWLEKGRVVRRGEKSIKGLFHYDQTQPIPNQPSAKPAISAEQKALFAKAKAALRSKKAKPQPTLV